MPFTSSHIRAGDLHRASQEVHAGQPSAGQQRLLTEMH
jgi:hypothetical protein